jgi:hypothetical protein
MAYICAYPDRAGPRAHLAEEVEAYAVKQKALRRWAAFHEAGHAVMRIVRQGAATAIDVSDDGSGYSRGTGTSIHVTDKIEIALAGPLAEARSRKISAAAIFMTGGRQDMEHASELAARWAITVGSDQGAVLREAEATARRFLRYYWSAVERLAGAVLESGSLTNLEVAAIASIE